MFDLWSIIHFCLWAVVGSQVAALKEPRLIVHWIYCFLIGLAWEVFEYFGQRAWPDTWSGRIEPWYNAWISDPLFNLLGVTFGWLVVAYYRKNYKP